VDISALLWIQHSLRDIIDKWFDIAQRRHQWSNDGIAQGFVLALAQQIS